MYPDSIDLSAVTELVTLFNVKIDESNEGPPMVQISVPVQPTISVLVKKSVIKNTT